MARKDIFNSELYVTTDRSEKNRTGDEKDGAFFCLIRKQYFLKRFKKNLVTKI